MLADDARMTMPPWPSWYSGRDAIATFLRSRSRPQALAGPRYRRERSARRRGLPLGGASCRLQTETIIVLTFQAARIEEITAFRSRPCFSRASACPSN